jgi:hypothetical protein
MFKIEQVIIVEYQVGEVGIQAAPIKMAVDLLQIIEQDIFFMLEIYRSFYKPIDA